MRKDKKQTLIVKPWPALGKRRPYKGRIRQAQIDRKRKALDVIIENLEPSQAGRFHEFGFQLPVRPGNPTSLFLTACGKDASEPGDSVSVSDVAGTAVGMRFHDQTAAGVEDVTFERIPQVHDGATHPSEQEVKQTSSRDHHSLPYGKDTP